jgi:transposase
MPACLVGIEACPTAHYWSRRLQALGHSAFQQLRCVEAFLKYLKYQHAQLQSAYHEFGADRSGASFVIKQIENAVGYFKNPTISPAQRNWLDDQTTLYL